MMELFAEGGYMMWVIALAGALVFGFAARAAPAVFGRARTSGVTTYVDAVLFWGGFALAAGFLGTAVGLYMMSRAAEAAGEVAASLMWGGLRVTMITTQFGLLVFLVALLLWFGLWYAARRDVSSPDDHVLAVEERIESLERSLAQVRDEQAFERKLLMERAEAAARSPRTS
jgi:hypothetical protein